MDAIYMNVKSINGLYLVAIVIALYAYIAFRFSKIPDPSTEFGISLNAMLAMLISLAAGVVTLLLISLVGKAGYLIAAIVLYFPINKIIKKMTEENEAITE